MHTAAPFDTPDAEIAALRALLAERNAALVERDARLLNASLEIEKLKVLVWDGQGLVLVAKRLERGKFVWPRAASGVVSLTPAMLSMLFEGIDWRMPAWTARPAAAV